MTVQKSNEKYS